MPQPAISDDLLGRIHHGDCIAGMNGLPAGSIDLAFRSERKRRGEPTPVLTMRRGTQLLPESHRARCAMHYNACVHSPRRQEAPCPSQPSRTIFSAESITAIALRA